jgi:hypothetical protein
MKKPIPIFANKHISIDWLLPLKGDKLGHLEKPKPSVAIVGSSGILLDKEYGKDIDSHNIIMRFNMARVNGFEKHVGSKTHIRILNGHTFAGNGDPNRFSNYNPNFLMNECSKEHFILKDSNSSEFIKGVVMNANQNYLNFFNQEFLHYCQDILQGGASVGFMGLMFTIMALNPSKINCYGFDHGEIEGERRHYWEAVRDADNWKTGQGHAYNKEKEIFQHYVENNTIKIWK